MRPGQCSRGSLTLVGTPSRSGRKTEPCTLRGKGKGHVALGAPSGRPRRPRSAGLSARAGRGGRVRQTAFPRRPGHLPPQDPVDSRTEGGPPASGARVPPAHVRRGRGCSRPGNTLHGKAASVGTAGWRGPSRPWEPTGFRFARGWTRCKLGARLVGLFVGLVTSAGFDPAPPLPLLPRPGPLRVRGSPPRSHWAPGTANAPQQGHRPQPAICRLFPGSPGRWANVGTLLFYSEGCTDDELIGPRSTPRRKPGPRRASGEHFRLPLSPSPRRAGGRAAVRAAG